MDELLADCRAGNVARLKAGAPQIPFGDGQALVKFCAHPACPCGPAVIDDVPGGALLCDVCLAATAPKSTARPPKQSLEFERHRNGKQDGDPGTRNPVYAHADAAPGGGTRLEI